MRVWYAPCFCVITGCVASSLEAPWGASSLEPELPTPPGIAAGDEEGYDARLADLEARVEALKEQVMASHSRILLVRDIDFVGVDPGESEPPVPPANSGVSDVE
jgi:hypothetical protein